MKKSIYTNYDELPLLLNVKQLVDLMGVSESSMQSFFYICEYLGVTPKEFFDDENTDPTALREFIQEAQRLDAKSMEYILGIMKELNSRK